MLRPLNYTTRNSCNMYYCHNSFFFPLRFTRKSWIRVSFAFRNVCTRRRSRAIHLGRRSILYNYDPGPCNSDRITRSRIVMDSFRSTINHIVLHGHVLPYTWNVHFFSPIMPGVSNKYSWTVVRTFD